MASSNKKNKGSGNWRLMQTTLASADPTPSSISHSQRALSSEFPSHRKRFGSSDDQDDINAIKFQSNAQQSSRKASSSKPAQKRRKTMIESSESGVNSDVIETRLRPRRLKRFKKSQQDSAPSDERKIQSFKGTSSKGTRPQSETSDEDDIANEVEKDREAPLAFRHNQFIDIV
jgi:hypothetical protein